MCGDFSPAIGSAVSFSRPAPEELLQGAVLVAGLRGAVAAQQPGDPPLHVLLAHFLPSGAAGLREQVGGGELMHRPSVGQGRLGGLPLDGQ